jgi:YbbR domain-containing protein
MLIKLKNVVTHNALLKVISFILGFSVWFIASRNHITSKWLTVPVCFDNHEQYSIEAPEHMMVQLTGTRATLSKLQEHECALHLDIQRLGAGRHKIPVTGATLFLPNSVNVVNYCPTNASVCITKKQLQLMTQTVLQQSIKLTEPIIEYIATRDSAHGR